MPPGVVRSGLMAFPITPSATLRIVSAAALIAASGLPLAAAEGAATQIGRAHV